MTIKELEQIIIKNFYDAKSNKVDISGMTFNNMIVNLSNMKAYCIIQSEHNAEDIHQTNHKADYIDQSEHNAKQIHQSEHTVIKLSQSWHRRIKGGRKK